ncbi:YgaP family membrane protein [Actibacterium pelagium]|uniref:Inner membrane protein YgaP-like transmembrane domain-containing protein n=1 Tax=Actibacterium pelagium TaxID=2029103 RepID=A0A917AK93_9RHOB|nr:DUF2892 domain-containing protein [Actibacterium pelagium]GGE56765.1 hypothetical protein GCM10011517_25660 [Actibacterium pelagium]
MTKNVGTIDRVIRAAIGVSLLALALAADLAIFENMALQIIAVAVGLVMLTVSATRVCPIYSIFGFKTCEVAQ